MHVTQRSAQVERLSTSCDRRRGTGRCTSLQQAPALPHEDDDLVRVSDADYRYAYSATIRCYAMGISFRSIRRWPKVSDAQDGPDLAGWRGYCRIGA